jgi:hypothetical protein
MYKIFPDSVEFAVVVDFVIAIVENVYNNKKIDFMEIFDKYTITLIIST